MPDILQRLRVAYAESHAKALDMLPELFQAMADGEIIEPPCKVGDTVFTIEENCFDCEHCPFENEAHFDKEVNQICCDREDQHCPYSIEEHTVEGFELSGKDRWEISKPGEWGCEGLEHFSGADGECYFTRKAAEVAKKELESYENS